MYELPVKIERFENQFAILRNDMMGEFKWPTNNLPTDALHGDGLILTAHLQKNSKVAPPWRGINCLASPPLGLEEEKYSNMRVMLEELIN